LKLKNSFEQIPFKNEIDMHFKTFLHSLTEKLTKFSNKDFSANFEQNTFELEIIANGLEG
jgi:hypothetical protein